jgi:hypothetical protein
MGIPLPLRRDQLARFIPDNETILRFQNFFRAVSGGEETGGMSAIEYTRQELEFYIMTRGLD